MSNVAMLLEREGGDDGESGAGCAGRVGIPTSCASCAWMGAGGWMVGFCCFTGRIHDLLPWAQHGR